MIYNFKYVQDQLSYSNTSRVNLEIISLVIVAKVQELYLK